MHNGFQQDEYLVGTMNDPGAGQIGPVTTRSLEAAWNRNLVESLANTFVDYAAVHEVLRQKGKSIESFAQEGSFGTNVQNLQIYLAKQGYFPAAEVNGNFGPQTKEAVIQYQLEHDLISSAESPSAGVVGPKTLSHIKRAQGAKYYTTMRAYGTSAL
jgi:hypothetical protein